MLVRREPQHSDLDYQIRRGSIQKVIAFAVVPANNHRGDIRLKMSAKEEVSSPVMIYGTAVQGRACEEQGKGRHISSLNLSCGLFTLCAKKRYMKEDRSRVRAEKLNNGTVYRKQLEMMDYVNFLSFW